VTYYSKVKNNILSFVVKLTAKRLLILRSHYQQQKLFKKAFFNVQLLENQPDVNHREMLR